MLNIGEPSFHEKMFKKEPAPVIGNGYLCGRYPSSNIKRPLRFNGVEDAIPIFSNFTSARKMEILWGREFSLMKGYVPGIRMFGGCENDYGC